MTRFLPPAAPPGPGYTLPTQLREIQTRFRRFLALLEQNNRVLRVISDLEESSDGRTPFDLDSVRRSLDTTRRSVRKIVEQLIALGGERYQPLRDKLTTIEGQIARLLPGRPTTHDAPFVLWLDELGTEHDDLVGSKNAQLGELRRLGLPTPDGFAITTTAYHYFMSENGLPERIGQCIASVDLNRWADLERVSSEIRGMILHSPVPADLAQAIRDHHRELVSRSGIPQVALRSSGVGEDSLFSFAGQFASYLNVARANVVDAYREILASKFAPQAIYYFLSHSVSESDLAMGVGCVVMIDAASSGVAYTRDPIDPEDDVLLIHSVYGLGESLVDGTLAPDVWRIDRTTGSTRSAIISPKTTFLAMREEGGTIGVRVPTALRGRPTIDETQVHRLMELGLRVEAHYGMPQDIEWAAGRDGEVTLLQTRPLRLVHREPASPPEQRRTDILLSGGTTACPGAGIGPLAHAASTRDLPAIPPGVVLAAPTPFPGLVTAMARVSAIVTESGGAASHMATLAREYEVPTIVGIAGVTRLPAGEVVTVDATTCTVLRGAHPELVTTRSAGNPRREEMTLVKGFREVLALVAPLRLVHPSDPGFSAENCHTLHDITRYAHQKSMEEMFTAATGIEGTERLGLRLESAVPLPVSVIYLDREVPAGEGRATIKESELASEPMETLWAGIRAQGWPSLPDKERARFSSVLATATPRREQEAYAVKSYAVLGGGYMMLCLYLGYHFTTIEALCTAQPSKNYVRLQYKDGGAVLERRVRRIRLVAELLGDFGFENASSADFLDATLAYAERPALLQTLLAIGRLLVLTKQLDMALSSDSITDWYIDDFRRQLARPV